MRPEKHGKQKTGESSHIYTTYNMQRSVPSFPSWVDTSPEKPEFESGLGEKCRLFFIFALCAAMVFAQTAAGCYYRHTASVNQIRKKTN